MDLDWTERAGRELLRRRDPSGGWAYGPGGSPSAEPTALAGLALLRSGASPDGDFRSPDAMAAVRRAGTVLASLQQPDGSVPSASVVSAPGWTTAHALLLWRRLGDFAEKRRLAREYLLRTEGRRQTVPAAERGVAGHDLSLAGWPWVSGTHSWIEPTAMAIIALCAEGDRDHPRVLEGIRLLRDRAIPGGGWNYGNSRVFGRDLRPQPGPTGASLLAMAVHREGRDSVVAAAEVYLLKTLPTMHSAISVGWGVMGLAANDACPPESAAWLECAYEKCAQHHDSTVGLSLLLLAGSGRFWTTDETRIPTPDGSRRVRSEGIRR